MNLALGVSDLVAVNAALDHLALEVELRRVAPAQNRVLLWRGELRRRSLLAGQLGSVLRILPVQLQRSLQRLSQSLDGDVVDPGRPVRARAEATVNRAVAVEKERGERLIGVELEQRQVQAVGGHDANADEPLQQRPDAPVLIDQVIVEFDALVTRDAAHDHEQWLAGLLRLGEAARQVVVDPEPLRLDLLAIRPHPVLAGLGDGQRCRREGESQTEKKMSGHEAALSWLGTEAAISEPPADEAIPRIPGAS